MKIKYFLFGILTSLSFATIVNAATLELKTDDKLVINEKNNIKVYVNLKLDESEELENISFDLDFNSELLTISAVENENGYAQVYKAGTAQLYNAKDFIDGTVMSFNVTNISSEDGTAQIGIKNIKVKHKDEEVKELEYEVKPLNVTLKKEVTTTTRALNTSAELKGIKLNNNATLKPAFSKDITEYKIYISKDTIKQVTISPQFEQSGVQMEVECTLGCTPVDNAMNKLNLVIGKNEATYTFTSEDGKDKKVYKFIIYRGATTDGSNLLADLKIDGYEIKEKFDKSKLDYTATVPYSTEKLTVVATPEDSNADVSIKGNDSLSVGENVITVTVTSTETEEKKIYNITVTREDFVPDEENTTAVTPKIEKTELPKKNNNIKLIIIIGVISTLIIGVAAYFIFFYKGKNKKNKSKDTNLEVNNTPKIQNSLIDEDIEPTSVDDALKDLMATKEMSEIDDETTLNK